MAQMLYRQLIEQRLEALAAFDVIEIQRLEDGEHVLLDRQLAKDGGLLREVPDARSCALIHGERGDVASVEKDPAFFRPDQARDHVKRRRLPRPIWTQQADDFSLREIQGYVVDDAPAFVGLHEMLGFQAAAAAHDRMLAAHRFAARDRVFGQLEKMRGCGRTVGWHAGPDIGCKGDRYVAPERAHW